MTTEELQRALRQLRLGAMADVLSARLVEARTSKLDGAELLTNLVRDELDRRSGRRAERRMKLAAFRDPERTLDGFDFDFNKKMNRKLIFELATGAFVDRREDVLFLGPPGTGKSHLAQAIGIALVMRGVQVRYFEAYTLLDLFAEAAIAGTRKELMNEIAAAELLIVDDLGMRKLPPNSAEDMLELIMRRYERGSTLLASNRPLDDWGKMLGDTASASATIDRLMHHAHVLEAGPLSWRMKRAATSKSAQVQARP
jgi:DNA replication protein DnaC